MVLHGEVDQLHENIDHDEGGPAEHGELVERRTVRHTQNQTYQ